MLRSSNRTLPIHRSRIDRMLFAISSRRLLIFSSTDYDDLELPRNLRRGVNTFPTAHIARGGERRDRERATRRFRVRQTAGPGRKLGPVRAPCAHVECF